MKKSSVNRVITMAVVAAAFTLAYAADAANIGFVRNPSNLISGDPFDAAWVPRLQLQGHTVTVLDQAIPASDASLLAYDLFIVSQDVSGPGFRTGIGVNQPKPMLLYEPALYTDIFGAGNGSSGGVSGGVTILNSSHPLAQGLSGTVSLYTGPESTSRFNVSEVSPGTTVIASMASTPENGIFAVLEAGALGGANDTNTWSHLRIALPAHDSWVPASMTPDAWKLLDGAVTYALVPEPSSFALLGLGMAIFLARRQLR